MVREWRRLLIEPARLEAAAGAALPLTAEERRYLTRVLRYGPGDRFAVADGAGRLWSARLCPGDTAELEQPLLAPLEQQAQPAPALVLAVAVMKRDFDVVLRMAVELGVDRLIPLLCAHTAVLGQLKPERWRSVMREAAEQCERLWLPQLDPPRSLAWLWAQQPDHPLTGPQPLRLWATTRLEGLQTVQACLAAEAPAPALWLACGPEGGWSPEEEVQAQAAGWQGVSLGPRILRSSTAAVAGLSALSLWRAHHHRQ